LLGRYFFYLFIKNVPVFENKWHLYKTKQTIFNKVAFLDHAMVLRVIKQQRVKWLYS